MKYENPIMYHRKILKKEKKKILKKRNEYMI